MFDKAALLIGCALFVAPSVLHPQDTVRAPQDAAIYTAVLEHIQSEHPERELALDRRFAQATGCHPHCADPDQTELPADVLEDLERNGLVAAVCTNPSNVINCTESDGQLSVRFSAITHMEAGHAEVRVYMCNNGCHGEKVVVLLEEGRWAVGSTELVWIT